MVKQEPEAYTWDDFVRDGHTDWTGVRNFQARNNLRAMKVGDRVLFYHSVSEKAVVGTATVEKEAFPDPTAKEGDWDSVRLAPAKPLKKPVTLQQIKEHPQLKEIALVRQSRLSVIPLTSEEFNLIVALGK
jgi:predicted RNA-binding protein with PUA-like domain